MTRPLTIALISDEAYLDGVVATLSGVLRASSPAPVHAVILDCGILDTSWSHLERTLHTSFPLLSLRRLPISPEQLRVFNPADVTHRLNNSSYARLLLPELLPDTDRILYLDCDLLVDADLNPLFNTPFDGALAAAVIDSHQPTHEGTIPLEFLSPDRLHAPAFNAGVLLMNLNAFRQTDVIAQMRALAASFQPKLQDQALLNHFLHGRWKPLSPRWNRQRFITENFSVYRDHPGSIWHFIGKMKPWHFAPSSMRGLVADFHRDLVSTSWIPRMQGAIRPRSPACRDSLKATRACVLRLARGLRPSSAS